MSVRNFEDLEVWKRGCQLAVDLYIELQDFKDYGLKDQIQRSAVSISSNIAEGSERASSPEYVRFLRIAKASCGELRTQLYILQKLTSKIETLNFPAIPKLIQESKEISKMLQALINAIQQHNA